MNRDRTLCFGPGDAQRGFTLIELIVVIVLVGTLAIVAIPRMADQSTFDAIGYAQKLEGIMRFAQKTAIAQRQLVLVNFSNNPSLADPTVTLATASTSACTAAAVTTPVGLPSAGAMPSSAVTVTATPTVTSLCFDPLGRPYAAGGPPLVPQAQLRLDINSAGGQVVRTFYVEASTGYIHE